MSLVIPPASFMAHESNLTSPASPYGTSVAASATPHAKNTTYTELIASTAFNVYALMVMLSDVGANSVDSSTLVDIAIGAAAAESVIIPNLNAGMAARQAVGGGQKYWFPLYIPSGSRISATAQSAVISQAVRTSIWTFGSPRRPIWAGSVVTDYGTSLATSRGVSVACGLSGAEGSYTQIVAATTKAHPYLTVGVGGAGDTTNQGSSAFVDVGVGAATESPVVQNLPLMMLNTEEIGHVFPFSVWAEIASGTRLAARASQVSASAQSIDVIAYGVS